MNARTPAVHVFSTCPREAGATRFIERVQRTLALTASAGFAGTLIYTGNDVPIEPWLIAEIVARHRPRLEPFIAVNPVYMHPFTVARCIASMAHMHGARCHVNLVAGTSLSDLEALDEADAHDERYERLREFGWIVRELCAGTHPVSVGGRFFGARHLRLPTTVPDGLQPVLVVAGQSSAAVETARLLGAESLGMLASASAAEGVHMAILARHSDAAAWDVARRRHAHLGDPLFARQSLRNTDATWKERLVRDATEGGHIDEAYWLEPFLRGQLDCPMLVGAVATVANVLRGLVARGIRRIVLELADDAEDYQHALAAFHLVGIRPLAASGGTLT